MVYGDDYQGNVCGRDNTNDPALIEGLARRNSTPRDHTLSKNQYFILPYPIVFRFILNDCLIFQPGASIAATARVCLPNCPTETIVDPLRISGKLICTYDVGNQSRILAIGSQCFFPYASTPVFNRCVPDVLQEATTFALDSINAKSLAEEAVVPILAHYVSLSSYNQAAIYSGRFVIGLSLLAAFFLGFIWLIMMRFFSGISIWFTVWACLLTLISLGAIMYLTVRFRPSLQFIFHPLINQSDELEASYNSRPIDQRFDADATNFLAMRYISYGVLIIAAICLLIAIFNGRNIQVLSGVCRHFSPSS